MGHEMTDDRESKRQKRLANLKPIKPGEVRNPHGSTVPKDIRELRQYTNNDVERKLHALLQLNTTQLKERLESPQTKNLERLLGVVLYKAMATADVTRASFILERAGCRLPPMVQPIALTVSAQSLREMPQGQLIDLGQQAIQVLQAAQQAQGEHGDDD